MTIIFLVLVWFVLNLLEGFFVPAITTENVFNSITITALTFFTYLVSLFAIRDYRKQRQTFSGKDLKFVFVLIPIAYPLVYVFFKDYMLALFTIDCIVSLICLGFLLIKKKYRMIIDLLMLGPGLTLLSLTWVALVLTTPSIYLRIVYSMLVIGWIVFYYLK